MSPEEAANIKTGENEPVEPMSSLTGRKTPLTPCSKPASPFKVISPRSHSSGISDWRSVSVKKPDPNIDEKNPNPVSCASRFQDNIGETSWVPRNIRNEFEETYIYFLKYFADKRRHSMNMLIDYESSFFFVCRSPFNICGS